MRIILGFILLLCSLQVMASGHLPANRHISVTGTAKLMAKPDAAVLHFEVQSLKLNSLAAKREVDDRINNLLDGLQQFEIKETDVSASNISTVPQYTYARDDKKKLNGYLARRTLQVTLKQLQHLNDFMDFALGVKVNQIRNIELKSSQEQSLKNQVNLLAVKDAKQKAQSLAEAFGAQLGHVYSVNSMVHQHYQRFGSDGEMEMLHKSDMVQTKPGRYLQENIIFSASINAVFDLNID